MSAGVKSLPGEPVVQWRPSEAAAVASHVPVAAAEPALRWSSLNLLVLGLAVGALFVLHSFLSPLLLAVWAALIVWPLQQRVAHRFHNRSGAAALLTVLLVSSIMLPLIIAVLSLSSSAVSLVHRVLESGSATEAFKTLSADAPSKDLDLRHLDLKQLLDLIRQHGERALGAGRAFLGALSAAIVAIVVFLSAFYCLLTEGVQTRDWFVERCPLPRGQTQRLANVFAEVGRGIIIGSGLTALLQGSLATVGYFVCGVPQALVLGLVTVGAALIPSVGTALVWVPVTVGLAVSGRTGAAVAMFVIGCVVSVVDNVMRPLLSRYAELRMHGLVLLVSMLGGIVVFGGWGLLFGPLLVRLAGEGLTMLKEQRAARNPVT